MIEFLKENPLVMVFFLSGLLANLVAIPLTIRDRHVKPLSRRIIEKAVKEGTWHKGILIKSKYHPSVPLDRTNGHWENSREYYTAWYEYEYQTFRKTAKIKIPKSPSQITKLFYRKGHPFEVYASEGFQKNGAKYNWIYGRILFFWIIFYVVLYFVFFGREIFLEAL